MTTPPRATSPTEGRAYAAFVLLVTCLGTSVACRDEPKPGPKATPTDASLVTEPSAAPVEEGPWAEWNMTARRRAWQGSHLIPGVGDAVIAIDVDGTSMKTWDGKTESTGQISLYGPCEVGISGYGTGAGKGGWVGTYTVENGALVTGLGNAGAKKGKKAIACVMGKMLALDENGACVEWTRKPLHPYEYESKPGTCAWAKRENGAPEVFTAKVYKMDFVLEVHGDALYDAQMGGKQNQRMPNWATAKAERDKHP